VCCQPFLSQQKLPETAEQLMRSRYTAYVLGAEDYLLGTWHASTRPAQLGLAEAAAVKWLGLEELRVEGGGPGDSEGIVEFVARCKPAGRAERLHEVSRFVREDGRWFYLDGSTPSR
jgi:SEC-C motif-containing protein